MPPKKTAPITLRVVRWFAPTVVGELDAVRRAQLSLAGQAFDGKDLPVEARLTTDPDDASEQRFYGSLEWRELIDDASGRQYDAWLLASDSGSYYEAGTTTLIAEMIQELVDSSDPVLDTALQNVSRWPIPKAMRARREAPSAAPAAAKATTDKTAPKEATIKKADPAKASTRKALPTIADAKKAVPKKASKKASKKAGTKSARTSR